MLFFKYFSFILLYLLLIVHFISTAWPCNSYHKICEFIIPILLLFSITFSVTTANAEHVFKLVCLFTESNITQTTLKHQQQIKRISLLPLSSGPLSCLLAKQNPVSLVLSYLSLHQPVACSPHLGTHRSPCVGSELHRRYQINTPNTDTRSSATPNCLLSVTELIVSGTVCLNMLPSNLPWLSSGPISKPICFTSRTPPLHYCTVSAQRR